MGSGEHGTKVQRIGAYGLAWRDDRLLVVRASAITEVEGRLFLPGGGVDHAEHPGDAIRREVWEETGLKVSTAELLGVVHDVRTRRRSGEVVHTVRIIYKIEVPAGEFTVIDKHGSSDEAFWLSVEELKTRDLAHYVIEAAKLIDLDLTPLKKT